MHNNRGLKSYF